MGPSAHSRGYAAYEKDLWAGKDPRRIPPADLNEGERAEWFKGWGEAQRKHCGMA